jgi:hypothetical protein
VDRMNTINREHIVKSCQSNITRFAVLAIVLSVAVMLDGPNWQFFLGISVGWSLFAICFSASVSKTWILMADMVEVVQGLKDHHDTAGKLGD